MGRETILVIDDHALFRSGIVAMLSTALNDISILDKESIDEALAAVAPTPTLVLLDLQMTGTGGFKGMSLIQRRWPGARIVVVSAHDLPVTVSAALAQGAVAFLSKADRPERMMTVLREVMERPSATSPTRDDPCGTLTPRQTEVLALVERGLSNKMIGRELGLSEHTVRGHVQALLSALGVARRAEAAFKARQLGLVR